MMTYIRIFPHEDQEKSNRSKTKSIKNYLVDVHIILPFPTHSGVLDNLYQ